MDYWMRDFKDLQRNVLMDREPSRLTRAARDLRDLLLRHRDRAVGGGMILAAAAAVMIPAPEKAKLCLPEGTAEQVSMTVLKAAECVKPPAQTVRAKSTPQP